MHKIRAPERVIHNATVYTANGRRPQATALAVSEGWIKGVGSDATVRGAFSDVPQVDARGYTIVPGFIDAHAHLHATGRALRRVDCTGLSSAAAVVERLAAAVAERARPADAWVRGHGWDHTQWAPPQLPSRDLLDPAFPERPVWLTRTDGHVGWANTAALHATVGLDRLRRMNDPPGGRIYRDDAGRPTGVLGDRAMSLVTDRLPAPAAADENRALRVALRHTARHGITGLHDAGVERAELQRIRRFVEAGDCPLRVSAMVMGDSDDFTALCQRGPWRHPSGRLDVTSTKLFADGALGSRGAALLDDYADAPGSRGALRHSPEALRRRVHTAAKHGVQVCTHAIGDRAARTVLDAYTAVARQDDVSLRRPRLEHAQVMRPSDVTRLAELGGVASVQPAHAVSDQEWAHSRLGPTRVQDAYAWPRLHAAGVPLAFGSDAPVEPLAPLRAFHAAVTEQTTPDGTVLSPALPRRAALHAHTRGAAHAAGRAHTVGTLTPGTRADWVVLSHDIMRVPAAVLPEVEVVATYLDGRCIHAQPDWPDP